MLLQLTQEIAHLMLDQNKQASSLVLTPCLVVILCSVTCCTCVHSEVDLMQGDVTQHYSFFRIMQSLRNHIRIDS